MFKFLIFFASVLVAAHGQIVISGQCQNVSVVQNFDIPAYGGLWNQIYRYEHVNELNADCVTAEYSLGNSSVGVLNAMVRNNTKLTIVGTAVPAPGSNGTGKLVVNFPTASNEFTDYWVLATDYVDYSYVYACTNLPNNNRRLSSWILSRTKFLSPQAVLAIDRIVQTTSGLNWESYRQTAQTETACRFDSVIETY